MGREHAYDVGGPSEVAEIVPRGSLMSPEAKRQPSTRLDTRSVELERKYAKCAFSALRACLVASWMGFCTGYDGGDATASR